MKQQLRILAASMVAGAGVTAAVAVGTSGVATTASAAATSTTTTTGVTAPPIQSRHKLPLALQVDTITGGGSPKPAAGCALTNDFVQGQLVVFRVWGNDMLEGGSPLTSSNVRAAYVSIPGVKKIALAYGAHGKVAYWTAPWSTAGYPLGTVNYTVTFVTKAVKASPKHAGIASVKYVWSQKGIPQPSWLTVT